MEKEPHEPPWSPRLFAIAFGVVGLMLGVALGLLLSDQARPDGSTPAPLYDEELISSLFESASPAIVELQVTTQTSSPFLEGLAPSGSGSGFLIDNEGHIVTNDHVVADAERIDVRLFDGRVVGASKLGTSPADDIALIKVDPQYIADIEPLILGDSDEVEAGQLAIAIGSPFLLTNTITVGIVSGTGRANTSALQRPIPNMIQTDAALNPGNSGGPLLNSNGEVIGVTTAVQLASPVQSRIGFAIPSNIVRALLPDLESGQQVRRPWLGISGRAVTSRISEFADLPVDKGVYVTSVFPDSPAENAGMVEDPRSIPNGSGDVITAVDGRPVESVADIVSYFNTLRPGDEITITVRRSGKKLEINVPLAAWPDL